MTLFLSSERLKADLLNDNVDDSYIRSATIIAQQELLEMIGDTLFNKLSEMVDNDIIEGTPYQKLLDDFIVPYLEFKVMGELCVTTSLKIGNIGLYQNFDQNANSTELPTVKYISTHYEQKAEFYRNRLIKYLNKNLDIYPEFRCNCENLSGPSDNKIVKCGLWLGGR